MNNTSQLQLLLRLLHVDDDAAVAAADDDQTSNHGRLSFLLAARVLFGRTGGRSFGKSASLLDRQTKRLIKRPIGVDVQTTKLHCIHLKHEESDQQT